MTLSVSGGRYDGASATLVFELFYDVVPRTAENFRCLCTGERGVGGWSGQPLHYQGCKFHRLIKDYLLQGGDIISGDGTSGDSIYGGCFPDERFARKHDDVGLLSMANGGPDTNSSQFFITLAPASHLDDVNVVFGKVVDGRDALDWLQEITVDEDDVPTAEIAISACGVGDGAADGESLARLALTDGGDEAEVAAAEEAEKGAPEAMCGSWPTGC